MFLVQDVTKEYNEFKAVKSISFAVHENEIIGILGENGAGKTTLINLISSIIKPSSGKIIFGKYEYGTQQYKQSIGVALGGEVSLYERLTVKENINYYSALYGIHLSDSKLSELAELLQFEDYINKRTENLSRGMQQRVSIAISLVNNPDMMLFDEPTIGLDFSGQILIKQLVQSLKNKGKTIIYSTNIIQEAREICERILILHKGSLIEFDTVANIEKKHGEGLEKVFLRMIRGSAI